VPDSLDASTTDNNQPRTIAQEIDRFVRQIDSLADTLPIAIHVIQAANRASREDFHHFLERECKVSRDDGKTRTYSIEGNKYFQFRRLEGRYEKSKLAHELVPRTFLVSLVSQFDAFLGRLIRHLFNFKPSILDTSANTLTFSQLTEFGSLEKAREYVVEKEIEAVLRKSHSEQFDWLENKFGLKLRVDLNIWPVFIEITERRNLFVHTNGMVSHQYLYVCRQHGSVLEPGIIPGKVLSVTRTYFETAHECLFEIGVKLAQVLWRKVQSEELKNADANLLSVGYELLEEGRYRLARCLLDFSTETLKKHYNEETRLAMVINRAQAYKWSGDEVTAQKIIGAVDWSATAGKFRLAQAVILDDFKSAVKLMNEIGAQEGVDKSAYREWPLFKEIRKVPEFLESFERIFGEPLNRVELTGPAGSPEGGIIQ
jgi:hypothetical protein